jgi:hypothetical protein
MEKEAKNNQPEVEMEMEMEMRVATKNTQREGVEETVTATAAMETVIVPVAKVALKERMMMEATTEV